MHAFIISSRSINNEELTVNNFAATQKAKIVPFILQKIEDVRELKKMVKFSFSERTAIVINDIDKITIEAANAFLKNLEEPTKNIIYILTANNLSNVLPTIISRCEVVKTTSNELRVTSEETKQFLKLSINQKLDHVGKIKDRNEAIVFIEELLFYVSSDLTRNSTLANLCENCLQTISALRANGNVSLQLTNFVVKMGNEDNP